MEKTEYFNRKEVLQIIFYYMDAEKDKLNTDDLNSSEKIDTRVKINLCTHFAAEFDKMDKFKRDWYGKIRNNNR